MKRIGLFGVAVSAMGLIAGITASPAAAITFSPGDRFTGNADFVVTGDVANDPISGLFFDFLDSSFATGGGTGNFGISSSPFNTIGAFVPYGTNGAISSENIIKDTNFYNGISITNFLSYNDGAGGLDEWAIDFNNINIISDDQDANFREIDLSGIAIFKGDNQIQGTGGFAAQIRIDKNNGTAVLDFEAENVPEPITLIGTGMAAGFAGLFRHQSQKRKKNQA